MESTLRVGVDSRTAVRGANDADKALDKLGRRAKTTETQFQKLTRSMGGMRSLFAGLGIGLAARQFLQLQDAAVTIDNKLRLATKTTAELNAVYAELRDISTRTRSSLEANAQLFQRIGLATKNLGLTYKEQTNLIEGFNQALIASGTQGMEVRAVTTQFAQAIGSGFKGDELRSIIEQAPKVAEVITDHLGLKSVTALKELASQGKVTPRIVVEAFKAAEKDLATLFAKVDVTGSQGFQLLRNSVVNLARDFAHLTGSSKLIGNTLKMLAANLHIVAGAAAGLAVVIGRQLVGAITKMTAAMLTNPVGLLITAFTAAGATAFYLGKQIFQLGETTATGFQIMQAGAATFWSVIKPVFENVSFLLSAAVQGFAELIGIGKVDFPSMGVAVRATFNLILGMAKYVSSAVVIVFSNVPASLEMLFKGAANTILTVFEKTLDGVKSFASTAAAIIALVDVDKAIAIQDALAKKTDFGFIDTSSEAIDVLKQLGAAWDAAFSEDSMDDIATTYNRKLQGIKAAAKKVDMSQLNNKFNPGSTAAGDEDNAKALKKLQKQREKYIKSLKSEYDTIRSETGGAQEVAREWYASQKQQLSDLGLSWEEYGGKVDAVFKSKLEEAYKKDLEAASNWEAGVTRAAMSLEESFGDSADAAEGVFTSVFSTLEDSLTDFVVNGELSLGNLHEAITRIAIQQSLLKPMSQYFSGGGGQGLLGGLFGGGGSGGSGGGLLAGLFKEGGMSTQPLSTAVVNSKAFNNAPQFASGGMSSGGGFPAILHPDEAVIPLSGGRKVPVDMGKNGGGNTNNINFNVTTQDANSFKRSEGQIMAKLSSTMKRAAIRNN